MNSSINQNQNKVKSIPGIILLITFIFNSDSQLIGQEKVNFSAGIGFPELLNLGLRYQLKQTQFGISFGYMPSASFDNDNKMISIAGDFYYHFGGFSEFSQRRPWYFRSGLIYCNAAGGNDLLWLNCRLGRDINLTKKVGLSIDAGIVLELYNEEKRNDPQSYSDTPTFILPGIGTCLFYRIGHL